MGNSCINKKLEAYLNTEGDKDIESIRISTTNDYITLRSVRSIGSFTKEHTLKLSDIYKEIREYDKNKEAIIIITDNMEIKVKELKDAGVTFKDEKADITFYL